MSKIKWQLKKTNKSYFFPSSYSYFEQYISESIQEIVIKREFKCTACGTLGEFPIKPCKDDKMELV